MNMTHECGMPERAGLRQRPESQAGGDQTIVDLVHDRLQRALAAGSRGRRHFVTLTYAQSIDGSIAGVGGKTLLLSNPQSQAMTHRLRALHDAILIGINTVLSDDPRLTVRLVRGQNPRPVVVDSRLRFPLDAKLLTEPSASPIIATTDDSCSQKMAELTEAGAQVIRLPAQANGLVDLPELLNRLKQLGIQSVMIEGGARIITSVLRDLLADLLVVTISPAFVGGLPAIESCPDPDQIRMPRLTNLGLQMLGSDIIVFGELHSNGVS
jgi:3,4-dihydroxy 2-butanone 4-phosphate synthase/GTP cyclohydrolase II